MSLSGGGKCATQRSRDDTRLTSSANFLSFAAQSRGGLAFFPSVPFHFGGNYFCWRAVCDVYLPTGGWNDSESEFQRGQSLPENQPLPPFLRPSLSHARFRRNCFFRSFAFPRLILDSSFFFSSLSLSLSLCVVRRCPNSTATVLEDSCKTASEISSVSLRCRRCLRFRKMLGSLGSTL